VGPSASTVHKMHDILRLGIARAAKVGQAVRMNRNSLHAHMRHSAVGSGAGAA
jgi:hypothetical protein